MRLEGSFVLFYLLDKQHKGKSYIGMCAVACRDIPHLSQASLKMSISNPCAPQRRNFSLPLFQFTTETPALSELIARADIKDVNATKFMKSNELLLSCTSNDNNRNRSKSTWTLCLMVMDRHITSTESLWIACAVNLIMLLILYCFEICNCTCVATILCYSTACTVPHTSYHIMWSCDG